MHLMNSERNKGSGEVLVFYRQFTRWLILSSIQALISLSTHATILTPSFTGFGKRPSAINL